MVLFVSLGRGCDLDKHTQREVEREVERSRERSRERERESVCVCVSAHVRVRVRVCESAHGDGGEKRDARVTLPSSSSSMENVENGPFSYWRAS